MTPEELRLECLKLVQQTANASGLLLEPGQIISRARAYADFVTNSSGPAAAEGVKLAQNPAITPENFSSAKPGVAPFASAARNGSVRAEPAGAP
jgi:hypothetical protein